MLELGDSDYKKMPMTECAPIVTPSTIETFAPIHTSSPMCTPSDFTFCERMSVSDSSKLWLKAKIEVDGPILESLPITMGPSM